MSDADVLERRLSLAGCRLAGTQLATEIEHLKAQQTTLIAAVMREAQAVAEATRAVERFDGSGHSMMAVDRGTDRAVAALNAAIEAIEAGFDGADLVPLTKADQARLASAQSLRKALFPRGTSFLKASFRSQWVELDALVHRMAVQRAALESFGFGAEKKRIEQWVALYGARLGVTQAVDGAGVDQAALAIADWHEAWGSFTIAVRYHYRGRPGEAIQRILLRPYEQQVEEERTAARRRSKRDNAGDGASEA